MISVLDTRVPDNNMGNYIIMEAIDCFLDKYFYDDFVIRIPYMDTFGKQSINYMKQSQLILVGGTNLLSSHMSIYKQVGFNIYNSKQVKKKVVLCGVGWWQYQSAVDYYTKTVLNNILSTEYIHSCRDDYTLQKLKSIGIENVVNTGCPSLWNINSDVCSNIPREKSQNVLTTITNYNKKLERDRFLFEILGKNYKHIYCWLQSPEDYEYVKTISDNVIFISPKLSALDMFLENNIVDYVGTRLHAGIRCIQHGVRSLIIGIDNRAIEMNKSFGLPIIEENRLANDLEKTINSEIKVNIRLPQENIDLFCSQFSTLVK